MPSNMYMLLAALAVVSVTSAAEDVTLFAVPYPSGPNDGAYSISVLGASPVSVDEGGATDYVYSQVYSWVESPVPSGIDGVFTLTRTLKADATRVLQEVTTTLPGDTGVQEARNECVHHENGTSVCQGRLVFKEEGATSTLIDVTVTGTPTPWMTIKGVESVSPTSVEPALPTDDEGGAVRASGHNSLLGVIVGFTLVLVPWCF